MWSSLFLVVHGLALFIQAKDGHFCDDYLVCMEKLEGKQRDCLDLDSKLLRFRKVDACTQKKVDLKKELNGLHLRRTELARDCAERNIGEAAEAEESLDNFSATHCAKISKKFHFSQTQPRRVKRSTKRRRTREKRKGKARECRNAARTWHRHCSELARCCPLSEQCKLDTEDILKQIAEGRTKLRHLKNECRKL